MSVIINGAIYVEGANRYRSNNKTYKSGDYFYVLKKGENPPDLSIKDKNVFIANYNNFIDSYEKWLMNKLHEKLALVEKGKLTNQKYGKFIDDQKILINKFSAILDQVETGTIYFDFMKFIKTRSLDAFEVPSVDNEITSIYNMYVDHQAKSEDKDSFAMKDISKCQIGPGNNINIYDEDEENIENLLEKNSVSPIITEKSPVKSDDSLEF